MIKKRKITQPMSTQGMRDLHTKAFEAAINPRKT